MSGLAARAATLLSILALASAAAAGAGGDALPQHPAQLEPLTATSTFPRHTAAELASAGYPDHKHVYAYPGFRPFVDEDGRTYGPLSLARGTAVLPREGLDIAAGEVVYRHMRVRFDPEQPATHALPMLEMLDWARRELSPLLGHDLADALTIVDTDDLDDYRARTGHAFHRLYRDMGEVVIVQPIGTLFARGLAPHAAFHLVAMRLLDELAQGHALPMWFRHGLSSYLSEEGPHFHGQLAMYRDRFPVVMSPDQAEALLTGRPDPDDEADKRLIRTAGYSAFLMAWELVEHRGGLPRAVSLVRRVGAGEDADAVARDLYGLDLVSLAADLDPTTRPEPVGGHTPPRVPQRPPTP